MKTIEYFENLKEFMEDRRYVRTHVGQYVAYKNYMESVRLGAEDFQVSDPPYNDEDTIEFISELKKAEVTRFCYTAKTTITIDFLYVCSEIMKWQNIYIGTIHRTNDIFGEEDIRGVWVEKYSNTLANKCA